MTRRLLLVDADIVAYQYAAKAQRESPFGVAMDALDDVAPKVAAGLADLQDQLNASGMVICLSCPSAQGWRKGVLPTYKENRSGAERPVLLDPLKGWLEATYPSYRKPTLEADDVMGILSTMRGLPSNFVKQHPQLAGEWEKVICSEDKDMKTIPGWLFNPAKDPFPQLISEQQADYWHLYQTLVGDPTDGYKGCPGVGPVKAQRALLWAENDQPLGRTMWQAVVELYESKGLTEEDALVQARVARICRATDYNFKTQQVILWTPPTLPPSTRGTASGAATTP